jgi:hypothetical protein
VPRRGGFGSLVLDRLFGDRHRTTVVLMLRFGIGIRDIEPVQPPEANRHIFIDRAGVGLLLGNAEFRKAVENLVSFDL